MSYDDSVHTLMATANWKASEKLSCNLGVAYSMSKSEIEDVFFASDPHTAGDRMDAKTPWKGTYDLANVNTIANTSRLEYNTLDFNIDVLYAFSERIDLTLKYLLTDIDDQETYVYGDESGLYHSLRAWITFHF